MEYESPSLNTENYGLSNTSNHQSQNICTNHNDTSSKYRSNISSSQNPLLMRAVSPDSKENQRNNSHISMFSPPIFILNVKNRQPDHTSRPHLKRQLVSLMSIAYNRPLPPVTNDGIIPIHIAVPRPNQNDEIILPLSLNVPHNTELRPETAVSVHNISLLSEDDANSPPSPLNLSLPTIELGMKVTLPLYPHIIPTNKYVWYSPPSVPLPDVYSVSDIIHDFSQNETDLRTIGPNTSITFRDVPHLYSKPLPLASPSRYRTPPPSRITKLQAAASKGESPHDIIFLDSFNGLLIVLPNNLESNVHHLLNDLTDSRSAFHVASTQFLATNIADSSSSNTNFFSSSNTNNNSDHSSLNSSFPRDILDEAFAKVMHHSLALYAYCLEYHLVCVPLSTLSSISHSFTPAYSQICLTTTNSPQHPILVAVGVGSCGCREGCVCAGLELEREGHSQRAHTLQSLNDSNYFSLTDVSEGINDFESELSNEHSNLTNNSSTKSNSSSLSLPPHSCVCDPMCHCYSHVTQVFIDNQGRILPYHSTPLSFQLTIPSTLNPTAFTHSLKQIAPHINNIPIAHRAPRWLPDDSSDSCLLCHRSFGILSRKHHCRACGTLACNACCSKTAVLPDLGYSEPVRVCRLCFSTISKQRMSNLSGGGGFGISSNITGIDVGVNTVNSTDPNHHNSHSHKHKHHSKSHHHHSPHLNSSPTPTPVTNAQVNDDDLFKGMFGDNRPSTPVLTSTTSHNPITATHEVSQSNINEHTNVNLNQSNMGDGLVDVLDLSNQLDISNPLDNVVSSELVPSNIITESNVPDLNNPDVVCLDDTLDVLENVLGEEDVSDLLSDVSSVMNAEFVNQMNLIPLPDHNLSTDSVSVSETNSPSNYSPSAKELLVNSPVDSPVVLSPSLSPSPPSIPEVSEVQPPVSEYSAFAPLHFTNYDDDDDIEFVAAGGEDVLDSTASTTNTNNHTNTSMYGMGVKHKRRPRNNTVTSVHSGDKVTDSEKTTFDHHLDTQLSLNPVEAKSSTNSSDNIHDDKTRVSNDNAPNPTQSTEVLPIHETTITIPSSDTPTPPPPSPKAFTVIFNSSDSHITPEMCQTIPDSSSQFVMLTSDNTWHSFYFVSKTHYFDQYGFKRPLPLSLQQSITRALHRKVSALVNSANSINDKYITSSFSNGGHTGDLQLSSSPRVKTEYVSVDYLTQELKKAESLCELHARQQALKLEVQGEVFLTSKWQKFMCLHPQLTRSHTSLRPLVREGIPSQLRGEVWVLLLESHKLKTYYDKRHQSNFSLPPLPSVLDPTIHTCMNGDGGVCICNYDRSCLSECPCTFGQVCQDNRALAIYNRWMGESCVTTADVKVWSTYLFAKMVSDCSGFIINTTANTNSANTYYTHLLEASSSVISRITAGEIEKDAPRTLTNNMMLGANTTGQQALRRVLVAYAVHNSEISYCQGMNLIAALLLCVLRSEEQAFWALTCVVEGVVQATIDTTVDSLPDLSTSASLSEQIPSSSSPSSSDNITTSTSSPSHTRSSSLSLQSESKLGNTRSSDLKKKDDSNKFSQSTNSIVISKTRSIRCYYHQRDLGGVRVDCGVVAGLVKQRLPKLHAVLDSHGLSVAELTVSWLLPLFVDVLEVNTLLYVWDVVLLEGAVVLVKVALGLLKMREEALCKAQDIGDVMKALEVDQITAKQLQTVLYGHSVCKLNQVMLVEQRKRVFSEMEQQRIAAARTKAIAQRKLSQAITSSTSLTPSNTFNSTSPTTSSTLSNISSTTTTISVSTNIQTDDKTNSNTNQNNSNDLDTNINNDVNNLVTTSNTPIQDSDTKSVSHLNSHSPDSLTNSVLELPDSSQNNVTTTLLITSDKSNNNTSLKEDTSTELKTTLSTYSSSPNQPHDIAVNPMSNHISSPPSSNPHSQLSPNTHTSTNSRETTPRRSICVPLPPLATRIYSDVYTDPHTQGGVLDNMVSEDDPTRPPLVSIAGHPSYSLSNPLTNDSIPSSSPSENHTHHSHTHIHSTHPHHTHVHQTHSHHSHSHHTHSHHTIHHDTIMSDNVELCVGVDDDFTNPPPSRRRNNTINNTSLIHTGHSNGMVGVPNVSDESNSVDLAALLVNNQQYF